MRHRDNPDDDTAVVVFARVKDNAGPVLDTFFLATPSLVAPETSVTYQEARFWLRDSQIRPTTLAHDHIEPLPAEPRPSRCPQFLHR